MHQHRLRLSLSSRQSHARQRKRLVILSNIRQTIGRVHPILRRGSNSRALAHSCPLLLTTLSPTALLCQGSTHAYCNIYKTHSRSHSHFLIKFHQTLFTTFRKYPSIHPLPHRSHRRQDHLVVHDRIRRLHLPQRHQIQNQRPGLQITPSSPSLNAPLCSLSVQWGYSISPRTGVPPLLGFSLLSRQNSTLYRRPHHVLLLNPPPISVSAQQVLHQTDPSPSGPYNSMRDHRQLQGHSCCYPRSPLRLRHGETHSSPPRPLHRRLP